MNELDNASDRLQVYSNFVASKIKSPELILEQLTTQRVNLAHLALGLVGEAIELLSAREMVDVMKELGDVEFYYAGLCYPEKPTLPRVPQLGTAYNEPQPTVLNQAGAISEYVKKVVMHGKSYDQPQFNELLYQFGLALACVYRNTGIVRDHVLALNINKLSARYKDGYSDAAAAARVDVNQN